MRTVILICCFLIISIAFLPSSFAAFNALAIQPRTSIEPKIYSCRELKVLYPEFNKLSHDEFKRSFYERFLSQYQTNPKENYTYVKYYVCRFHSDKSEQVKYMRKWIAAYEKQLKNKGSK
jgi:hypothetical protein